MKAMYEKNSIDAGDTFNAQQEIDKYRAIYYAGASGD